MQLHTWFDWVVVIAAGTFIAAVLLGSVATVYGSVVRGTLELAAFTVGALVVLGLAVEFLAHAR